MLKLFKIFSKTHPIYFLIRMLFNSIQQAYALNWSINLPFVGYLEGLGCGFPLQANAARAEAQHNQSVLSDHVTDA